MMNSFGHGALLLFFYNSVAQNVLHLVKHRVVYFCPGNSTDPTDPAGSNPSVELDPM